MDLTAYYDRYWAGKDDAYDRFRLRLLADPIPSGSQLLELGCGPGILGKILGERGVSVVGADLSQVALRRAADKGVTGVRCALDGEALPFKSGSFAYAASNSSLEHYFDPQGVLVEIYRVLANGGRFYWMVPNIGHWRFRLWLLFGRFPVVENSATDPLHLRMYTRAEAARALKKIGFKIRGVKGSPGTWVPTLYPLLLRLPGIRHLYERLAPVWPSLLCRYLVLEAEKVDAN